MYYSVSAPKLETLKNDSLIWTPKKEFFDTTKQLESIKKRVQLLKIENELREKKLQVLNQKSEILERVRGDHEQFKELKLMHREKMNVQLQNLISKTRTYKKQQTQDKEIIKQNIIQMKQQEYKNIKEQSHKNEQLIKQNLDKLTQQKYEQKINVVNAELQTFQTINNFRKQRYLKFVEEHHKSKSQHHLEIENRQQQIEELRKQEAYLLVRLDETTQQSEKLKLNQSVMKITTATPKTASNFQI
ncbi:hypothetical protein pb186bvf_014757 [Paramecium bursaria]